MFNKQQVIKGILILVVEISVLFAFYYYLVGRLLPPPFSLILSTLGSLFMLISIGCFIQAKAKYFELRLMQRALATRNIIDFKDGQKIVVFGQILPNNGQSIVSPVTYEKCIFYNYDIYQWVLRRSGKESRREKQSDYSGFYLTPSSINTSFGKIRLLAFPTLQGFEMKTYSYSDSTTNYYNNAYSYIQSTKFEEFGTMGLDKLGKAYQMIKEIFTDDDGYIRKDTKYSADPFDLKTRLLNEQYVKEGENVSLLGIWSEAKQGIITDMSKYVAILTRGLPEQTIKVVKKEFVKKISEGLLVFFVINLIVGTFWWIINEGPKYGKVTFTQTRNGQVVKQEVIGPTIQSEPSATPIELSFYLNTTGKYSYQYPSSWKHNEIINKDLNSPEQKILSVSSLIVNPEYDPMFGSLDISYQLDGGECIEKDERFLKDMIIIKTKVGNQTIDAYERQELNQSVDRIIYERFIFIPKDDRCYKLLILDQEGNPNSEVFKQILSSFQFLD